MYESTRNPATGKGKKDRARGPKIRGGKGPALILHQQQPNRNEMERLDFSTPKGSMARDREKGRIQTRTEAQNKAKLSLVLTKMQARADLRLQCQ